MKLPETKNFIVKWLKNYAESNNTKSFIIGISGGIDSSLTSTLCALTGIKTVVVSLPIHQKKNELNNAEAHAKWLIQKHKNVCFEHIELTNVFEKYKKTIPSKFHSDLNLANSRARLRMTTLYQIAAKLSGIVVGTGNKIEDFGIGFFTKYGDGGVDISPIADLTKSEVTKLAIFCGIIKNIINAAPTDGLWEDGRTDESQIGATYNELEWALQHNGKKQLTKREQEVLEIYKKLHKKNMHKMQPIPVCSIPQILRN